MSSPKHCTVQHNHSKPWLLLTCISTMLFILPAHTFTGYGYGGYDYPPQYYNGSGGGRGGNVRGGNSRPRTNNPSRGGPQQPRKGSNY